MRLALACLLLATPTLADPLRPVTVQPPAVHLSNGVICDGLGPTGPSEGTIDGEVVLRRGPIAYDVTGRDSPAEIGLSFGFHLRLYGTPGAAMTASVTHPPMGPEGRTHQTWPVNAFGDVSLGYVLEDDFELLPGIWTFRLHDGDRQLFEGDFLLGPAGSNEAVQRLCFRRWTAS